jgi:hypothetical protein
MPAATRRPSTRRLLLCCGLLVLLLQGQVAGGQLLMLQLQGGVLGTQRLEVLVGGCNLCTYGSISCIQKNVSDVALQPAPRTRTKTLSVCDECVPATPWLHARCCATCGVVQTCRPISMCQVELGYTASASPCTNSTSFPPHPHLSQLLVGIFHPLALVL